MWQENARLEKEAAGLAARVAAGGRGSEERGVLADILAASERMQRDKAQARAPRSATSSLLQLPPLNFASPLA
jgi:hypothetical protein